MPKQTNSLQIRVFLRIFLVVGMMLACLGGLLLIGEVRFQMRAIETTATVISVENEHSSGRGGGITFKPTFEFEHEGEVIEVTTPGGSSEWGFRVGEQIGVKYLPDEPARAKPTGWMTTWLLPGIPGIIGVGFMFLSIVGGRFKFS